MYTTIHVNAFAQCICLHEGLCAFVFANINLYTCIGVQASISARVYLHVHIPMCIYVCMCTCLLLYVCTCVYLHKCMSVCVGVFLWNLVAKSPKIF